MFEHLLAFELHKTIGEVRSMPNAEFRRWTWFLNHRAKTVEGGGAE